jgi:DNA-binding NtrC family response regulator
MVGRTRAKRVKQEARGGARPDPHPLSPPQGLQQRLGEPELFHGLWTRDAALKRVFRVIEKVAGEEETVLVRGDTGTGKELVARALHDRSLRHAGPFIAINCAALPPALLESELFGHIRGAFTGAVRDAPGQFQLAHRGTLFLDEVAELPLELQAKLLRALETHTVLPVGGREPIAIDVRVVSATHRALRREVEEGRFRADLMYRLRVIPVFLPPLRERPHDVELLCRHFVEQLNARGRRRVEKMDARALEVLEGYDWPGNVRELRNVLAYAFAIGEGPILDLDDLPPELVRPELDRERERARARVPGDIPPTTSAPPPVHHGVPWAQRPVPSARVPPADVLPGLPPSVQEAVSAAARLDDERSRILAALSAASGLRERAAELLGMSRITLWRRMRYLGLMPARAASPAKATTRRRRPRK